MQLDKIYKGDVIKKMKEMGVGSVDLIVSDPPYNLHIDDWDTFNTEDEFLNFTKSWLEEAYRVLSEEGTIYVFNTPYNCSKIIPIMEELGFHFINWITWYKKDGFSNFRKKYNNAQETILFFSKTKKYKFYYDNIRVPYESESRMKAAKEKGIIKNGKRWFPNPRGKLCVDVWEFTSERHLKKQNGKLKKQSHPTPKPEKMIQRMILSTTNEGDVVLDLFSGTGTTSVMAAKEKRHFIGIEQNEEYIKIARRRLSDTKRS